MWVLTSRKAQPGCRLPLVGTGNRHKGATEIAPLLIVRDESHRLSLGGLLSSRACLRFAGCVQFAMKEYGRSRNFQRTANSVLTVCVSSGDKCNMSQKTFSLVAGVFFLLAALGHVLRITSGASVVIQNTSIPMWAIWMAFVVTDYLAYEGITLRLKSL